jgi:TetR/AcrR family transcriptional regulator
VAHRNARATATRIVPVVSVTPRRDHLGRAVHLPPHPPHRGDHLGHRDLGAIEAAVTEFGEHGYAGVRISAIASRAGVNQQLISYYFDGKGLYRALQDRWRTISASANRDLPRPDVVAALLRLGVEQRSWAPVLAWDGLSGSEARSPEDRPFFTAMVDDLRRRQERGELAAERDPA